MSKELETKVAIRLLEKKIEKIELSAEALCAKVLQTEIDYKSALEDYTKVIEQIEIYRREISSYGKA